MPGVLDGTTVLDLTRLLPGACATLLLADLGADVIKIEDPGRGDPLRNLPPAAGGVGVYHSVLNRNKRSVTLDLRQSQASTILAALVRRADVVVESFRPQTARRLKVTADDLRPHNRRLVHCSITGFGQSGPYSARAGHDLNYLALAGLLALERPGPDRPPQVPGVFLADIGGGAMTAVAGILAALYSRERTGNGSAVDISLHEGALAWLTVPAAATLAGVSEGDVRAAPLFGANACYNVYRTADGRYVALGALEPKFWARFCQRVGSPHLIAKQFVSGPEQARIVDEVGRIFSTRTQEDWLQMFEDVDACLTPVKSVEEALDDPQVRERGVVQEHDGVRAVRTPVRIEPAPPESAAPSHREDPGVVLRRAPELGIDTDEVLRAAGFPADELRAFRSARLI